MLTATYKVDGGKLIKIALTKDVAENVIRTIKITGDFFLHPEDAIEDIERSLIGIHHEHEEIYEQLKRIIAEKQLILFGVDAAAFAKAIMMAQKRKWRLLMTGHQDAYTNMAMDEAMVKLYNGTPSLRFYGWQPHAVSLGYFQNVEQELDEKKCKELGVDIVRRATGGGAVFHDTELTYSFIIDEDDVVSRDIIESYHTICGSIIEGLSELGISAQFQPINDIIIGHRKISGNAQTRRDGKILQHGTILIDVDVEKMFSILKVPDEKMKDKLMSSVKDRVTCIHNIAVDITFEQIAQCLRKGFEKTFDVEFEHSVLREDERELTEQMKREKYKTKQWIYKR